MRVRVAINCTCVLVRSQIYNCPIDSPEEKQPPSHWEATAAEPELAAGHTFTPLRDCISFTKTQMLSLSKDGLYVNWAEQAICILTTKDARHAARSSTLCSDDSKLFKKSVLFVIKYLRYNGFSDIDETKIMSFIQNNSN